MAEQDRGHNYDVLPYRQDLYSFMYEDSVTQFRTEDGQVDYDAIIADNQTGATPHDGSVNGNYEGALIGSNQWGISADTAGTIYTGGGMVRRASMNSRWIGAISNLEWLRQLLYVCGPRLASLQGLPLPCVEQLDGL